MTLSDALARLGRALGERAAGDSELREALTVALQAALDVVPEEASPERDTPVACGVFAEAESGDGTEGTPVHPASPDAAPAALHVPEEDPAGLSADLIAQLKDWAQGGPEPSVRPRMLHATLPTDADLGPLSLRLRAKAVMAQWRAEGAPAARRGDVRSRAGGAPGVETWIVDGAVPDAPRPAWAALAGAYGAAADAAAALAAFAAAREPLVPDEPFAHVVAAAAEAQSGVRAAFLALSGTDARTVAPVPDREDRDQLALFRWLREATDVSDVFVTRHLRWGDPADPSEAPAVSERIRQAATAAGIRLGRGRRAGAEELLRAVAYHARRLSGDDDGWDAAHQTQRLVEKIDDAVRSGLAPGDARLQDLLAPVVERLPADEGVPDGARRVITALRRALDGTDEAEWAAEAPVYGPQVAAARALLGGKRMALFGGVAKPDRVRALEEAFGLAGVEWVESRTHQSPAAFEAVVARNDVAILLIRWCSHSFEALRAYCDGHGTAYVRLPSGYHPNMVAHHVLDQISDVLRA